MAFIQKPPADGSGSGGVYNSGEDSFAASFPAVAEFLSLVAWEDKSRRKTGTLMLLSDAGVCKAWVHDVDGKRSTFVSADSFWGLLEAVERGLRDNELGWRPDRK